MPTQEQLDKLAFDNLQEHLRWMVREKMIQEFGITNDPGLPHIRITVVPMQCKDCGKDKNISTEKL